MLRVLDVVNLPLAAEVLDKLGVRRISTAKAEQAIWTPSRGDQKPPQADRALSAGSA
jgi:hypothetical protein